MHGFIEYYLVKVQLSIFFSKYFPQKCLLSVFAMSGEWSKDLLLFLCRVAQSTQSCEKCEKWDKWAYENWDVTGNERTQTEELYPFFRKSDKNTDRILSTINRIKYPVHENEYENTVACFMQSTIIRTQFLWSVTIFEIFKMIFQTYKCVETYFVH